jgi:hypothetical protein
MKICLAILLRQTSMKSGFFHEDVDSVAVSLCTKGTADAILRRARGIDHEEVFSSGASKLSSFRKSGS